MTISDSPAPPDDSQRAEAEASGAPSIWQFLKDNFPVLSGLAVIGGLALSIAFLFSYLSTFDWHLIVFIQYTDVITFGVIAVGVVSGSITLLFNILQLWIGLHPLPSKKAKWRRWLIVGCSVAAVFALNTWLSIRAGDGYLHDVFGLLLLGLATYIVTRIAEHVRRKQRPAPIQFLWLVFFLFLVAGVCGQWLANSVLEMAEFDQDVRTKDLTLNSAKLVIVLSRFSIFLKDKMLYIVPTSDIIQLRTSRPLTTILSGPETPQIPAASPTHSP